MSNPNQHLIDNLRFYSVESLIEMIVKIGKPLPVYNYDQLQYQTDVFENLRGSEGNIKTVIAVNYHHTFRIACESILIEYYNEP